VDFHVPISERDWGVRIVSIKKPDLLTSIVVGIVLLIVLVYVMYAFLLVLLSFGILAVIGFVIQCMKAFRDGKLTVRSTMAFGLSSVISAALGEVVGQLFTGAVHDMLSGQIVNVVVTGVCIVITYVLINKMSHDIDTFVL
jgi:uncharacterized membrane protein HdeD (DUF308 family)